MVKLWIKVVRDNKIIKHTIVERDEKFSYAYFRDYVSEGCYALDEATPAIIRSHLTNFAKFHRVVFTPSDFVETVSFDKLVVEELE